MCCCFVFFVFMYTPATRHAPQGGRIAIKSSRQQSWGTLGGNGFLLPIKGLKPAHAVSLITSQSIALIHLSTGLFALYFRATRAWRCLVVSRAVWDNATHFPASFLKPLCLSLTSHLAAAQRGCAPHPHPRLTAMMGEGARGGQSKPTYTHKPGWWHARSNAAFVVRGDCASIDKRRRMESSTGPSPRWVAPPLAN